MKLKTLFFMLILLTPSIMVIPSVMAETTKTFYGIPDIVISDWGEFWRIFRQHAAWKLEGNRGECWENANEHLTIQREYPSNNPINNTCKLTLIFDAPLNADYRFTFGIDKKAKQYLHKQGSWNYILAYEGYAVIFDWSDIKEIPNLIVTHGVTDNLFWFRIRKDNVQQGVHIEIDPTITVYVTSSDGYLERNNSGESYNDAWAATIATTLENITMDSHIGQVRISDTWVRIRRTYLYFDTSEIPDDVTISNVILTFYVGDGDDISDTDFNITIQNGMPTYPHDPLVLGDYNKAHYSGNGGYLNTVNLKSDYPDDCENNITLTSEAISWINKEGTTKFCLRSSRDIDGIDPTGDYPVQEYIKIMSASYHYAKKDPQLIITYPPPFDMVNSYTWIAILLAALFLMIWSPAWFAWKIKKVGVTVESIERFGYAILLFLVGFGLFVMWAYS